MVELREQPASNWLPPNHNDIGAIEMARKSLLERFEEKYCPEPNSGCWLWTGASNGTGYGSIGVNGKTERAHRVSWRLHIGEIPKGMHVLHKCDTPCCVRPDHLWLGRATENMADRDSKGRGPNGEKNGKSKLTDDQAMQIFNDSRPQALISNEYNIDASQVSMIKSKKAWRHIHA